MIIMKRVETKMNKIVEMSYDSLSVSTVEDYTSVVVSSKEQLPIGNYDRVSLKSEWLEADFQWVKVYETQAIDMGDGTYSFEIFFESLSQDIRVLKWPNGE